MKEMDLNHIYKQTPKKDRRSEAGNAILMLFAAIGMAGVVTYGLNNVMRGPAVTTSEISRKTIAENNLVASTRLAIAAAARSQTNEGDCDSDGFVEPVPFRDAGVLPAPAGGGLLPMTIGASMTDPWGGQYGYCVWDSGTVKTSDDNVACGGNTANRLDGGPRDNQPAIAVISAGKNGAFETVCNAYLDVDGDGVHDGLPDDPLIDRDSDNDGEINGDDIVLSYTYAEANGIGGGLWKLKEADQTTAEISKNLEVGGGGTFSGPVELTSRGLVLPGDPGDGSVTGACDAAKDQQLRRNTSVSPPTIEICDFANGGTWQGISGSGNAGYFDPQGANCTENAGGPISVSGDIAVTNTLYSVWADGNFVYLANGGGNVGVYQFDGAAFSLLTSLNSAGGNTAVDVWGDGNYVYIANGSSNTLEAWFFNGKYGIYIDDVGTAAAANGVMGDGTYIYVAAQTALKAFTFNGVTLTEVGTTAIASTQVWSSGTHIFTAGGDNTLRAYTFNGTAFTAAGTVALPATANDIWGDGTYIYTATGGPGLQAYSYDGAAFTLEDTYNPAGDVVGVWGDGVNVYAGSTSFAALTFDGNAFVVDNTYTLSYTGSARIWGDGNFIYGSTLNQNPGTLFALGGYNCTAPAPYNVITAPILDGNGDPDVAPDALDVGLVAHWPMNEGTGTTIEDVIGGNTGTFTNTPVWTKGPQGESGLSFDMDDRDAVQVTGLLGTPTAGTMAAWVNAGRIDSSNYSHVFDIGDYVMIEMTTGRVPRFTFKAAPSGYTSVDSSVPLSKGWHYVVATFDEANDAYRIYVDGVMTGTLTSTDTINYTGGSANTMIGRSESSATYDFDGGVDDVRFYNRALSPNEVSRLYKKMQSESIVREISGTSPAVNFKARSNRLAVGDSHGCAIKRDGTPWCWGDNGFGQLGYSVLSNQYAPVPVAIPTVQKFYLTNTNSDLAPGGNLYSKKLLPLPVTAATNATALAAGATNNGYGFTEPGIFGKDDGSGLRTYSATMSNTANAASACMRASVFAARVNSTGTVQGSEVQLGASTLLTAATTTFTGEADLGTFGTTDRLRFRYSMQNTCGGGQTPTINFNTSNILTTPMTDNHAWVQISTKDAHTCAIRGDGTAWCWGQDNNNQLGNGTILTGVQPTPSPVDGGSVRWKKVSAGFQHTCGIKDDGTAWCWGADPTGNLGNGAAGNSSVPSQVTNSTDTGFWSDWVDISVNQSVSCGIRANGLGYCWGSDVNGRLGNGAAIVANQVVPSLIDDPGPWVKIHPADFHTCGVKTDGSAWCWGGDADEVLGLPNSTTDQPSPVLVPAAGPWADIVTERDSTCALHADSNVWCWGNNLLGYLGVAPFPTPTATPVKVLGSEGSTAMGLGSAGGCLMKKDNSVHCWGFSSAFGEFGNNTLIAGTQRASPVIGFPERPNWNWNDAGSLIVPPYDTNIALNGHYLSTTASQPQGLGFTTHGRANLRRVSDSNQLLIETTGAGASAQVSFENNVVLPPFTDFTSLAAKWEMTEGAGTTVDDTSANSNTATLGGGVAGQRPVWTTGLVGGALDFDAVNDYLAIANNASINLNGTITISSWVYLDDAQDPNIIYYKGTPASSTNIQVLLSTYLGEVFFVYCSAASASCGTPNELITDGANLQNNRWHHIAISWDEDAFANIYVDGVLQTNDPAVVGNPVNNTMRTSTQPVTIGRGYLTDNNQYYFGGLIDDVRIYNTALAASEILQLYVVGGGTVGGSGPAVPHSMGIDHVTNNFEIGRNIDGATNFLNAINPDIALTATGDLGIGSAAPASKVDVDGGVKFGTEVACDAPREGGMRYNSGDEHYEYCDGAAWQPFPAGGGGGGSALWNRNRDTFGAQEVGCALKTDGSAWCVGDAYAGRLGNNQDSVDTLSPVRVHTNADPAGWSDWVSIVTSGQLSCGLRANGTAWCWGESNEGQTGTNTYGTFTRPAQVRDTAGTGYWSDWKSISVNNSEGRNACGIRANGKAYCWGYMAYGALGNNTNSGFGNGTPQEVHTDVGSPGWSDWIQISSSFLHTCGLRANGTAWCWGTDGYGQLGNGTGGGNGDKLRPFQVRDSAGTGYWTDWKQISANGVNTCGIRTNGTAWCWGGDSTGQVGDDYGGGGFVHLPREVGGNGCGTTGNWAYMSAGGYDANCGIKVNGTLYCWGRNQEGALGIGTGSYNESCPQQVRNDTNTGYWSDWIAISAGYNKACATRATGQLYCWGEDVNKYVGGAGNRTYPGEIDP